MKKKIPVTIKAAIIGAVITGIFILIIKIIPDKKALETTGNYSPGHVEGDYMAGDKNTTIDNRNININNSTGSIVADNIGNVTINEKVIDKFEAKIRIEISGNWNKGRAPRMTIQSFNEDPAIVLNFRMDSGENKTAEFYLTNRRARVFRKNGDNNVGIIEYLGFINPGEWPLGNAIPNNITWNSLNAKLYGIDKNEIDSFIVKNIEIILFINSQESFLIALSPENVFNYSEYPGMPDDLISVDLKSRQGVEARNIMN